MLGRDEPERIFAYARLADLFQKQLRTDSVWQSHMATLPQPDADQPANKLLLPFTQEAASDRAASCIHLD